MKANTTIRAVKEKDKNAWDKLTAHPLQSWAWGNFREKMGIKTIRLGVYKNGKLKEGWQIFFHKLPIVPFTVGYFPKGPNPTSEMIKSLVFHAQRNQAIYIQLEPNIRLDKYIPPKDKELIPSHRPLFTKYTFCLDLLRQKDQLLSSMHPKTRYNIKVARNYRVMVSLDNSDTAFNTYLKLLTQTQNRQKFYAHSTNYHKTMWKELRKDGIANLFTAKYKNKTLVCWITFIWNDTIYYPYGASSSENRNVMASNLMLWEIALWAKKVGLKKFDLWGALSKSPDPQDPWFGFHRFKKGYGGDHIEFAGSFDLIINKPLYKMFTLFNNVRLKLLNIKRD